MIDDLLRPLKIATILNGTSTPANDQLSHDRRPTAAVKVSLSHLHHYLLTSRPPGKCLSDTDVFQEDVSIVAASSKTLGFRPQQFIFLRQLSNDSLTRGGATSPTATIICSSPPSRSAGRSEEEFWNVSTLHHPALDLHRLSCLKLDLIYVEASGGFATSKFSFYSILASRPE